jgi:lathosterol oxidase
MISFVLHILGYDIWFYISHILLHTPLLWKYHKIHHKIINPKWTDTYTGHWLEGPFQSLGFLLPLIFLHFNSTEFLFALAFVNIRGMARHDNRTAWLIGNHHILHHQYFNYNYGEYWIDKLCGTLIKDISKN